MAKNLLPPSSSTGLHQDRKYCALNDGLQHPMATGLKSITLQVLMGPSNEALEGNHEDMPALIGTEPKISTANDKMEDQASERGLRMARLTDDADETPKKYQVYGLMLGIMITTMAEDFGKGVFN
ncbi:unnamed protein product [Protopolystoma xenopodis]|uniref:Uncharacterized protein n=1 Tax=Protopolystoma xenopodis TaxID=117903 RepID=A0A448WTX6_9PLAT|nr:unnamed protein product [Protopolystoma xenopodis]